MFRFRKSERITSLKEINHLFERGCSSAVHQFPLRAVYQTLHEPADSATPPIKVLISVAKKKLRHATDRNRAKRQIREAYRLQHQSLTHLLLSAPSAEGKTTLRIAFIWLSDTPLPSADISAAMHSILSSIEDKLQKRLNAPSPKQ